MDCDKNYVLSLVESTSEKGKPLLICNEFKFHFHKSYAGGEERWMCAVRSCKSFLRSSNTSPREIFLNLSVMNHNHSPIDKKSVQQLSLLASVKRKATSDSCEKPSKLLHSCVTSEHKDLKYKDFKNAKQILYRARRKILPTLPTNLNDIHESLSKMSVNTKFNENFLLLNDPLSNLIVFSTDTNLKYVFF